MWLLCFLKSQDRNENFHGAPDLAVEVVSSETASQLETKIRGYLRGGSRVVWVAYPEQRIIRVCRPDGTSRWLEWEEMLEEAGLLPGFQLKVADVFDGA